VITGIYLKGETSYYVRRLAFILWVLMGVGMIISGLFLWGLIFLSLGGFGIATFGLRRYSPSVGTKVLPHPDPPTPEQQKALDDFNERVAVAARQVREKHKA